MMTLEELLISRGEIDRIYCGVTSLYLWRALLKTAETANPLYPDFEERVLPSGRRRAADVNMTMIKGILHVKAELGKGVSLFDVKGTFGDKKWDYFEIPKGTPIPSGLIIVKDGYNDVFNATHYSISPNKTMPKKAFCRLLDELARNAIIVKGGMNA
ncbi:MAG TPA: hypothetical protein VEC37_18610 [Bacillota bacterium]|nr:hypothetical protein [Bacillota bacterium]